MLSYHGSFYHQSQKKGLFQFRIIFTRTFVNAFFCTQTFQLTVETIYQQTIDFFFKLKDKNFACLFQSKMFKSMQIKRESQAKHLINLEHNLISLRFELSAIRTKLASACEIQSQKFRLNTRKVHCNRVQMKFRACFQFINFLAIPHEKWSSLDNSEANIPNDNQFSGDFQQKLKRWKIQNRRLCTQES